MKIFLDSGPHHLSVDVNPTDRISLIKRRYTRSLGLSSSTTFFRGKQLDESRTFQESSISNDDTITFTIQPRQQPRQPLLPLQQLCAGKGIYIASFLLIGISIFIWFFLYNTPAAAVAPPPSDPPPLPPPPRRRRHPPAPPKRRHTRSPPPPHWWSPPPPSEDLPDSPPPPPPHWWSPPPPPPRRPSRPPPPPPPPEVATIDCVLALQYAESLGLTVFHGLWPPETTPNPWIKRPAPAFDITLGYDAALTKRANKHWIDLKPNKFNVSPRLHNPAIWKEQWDKHGVYSGLTQKLYMTTALDLFESVVEEINGPIKEARKSKSTGPVLLNTAMLNSDLSGMFAQPKIICVSHTFHSIHFNVEITYRKTSPPEIVGTSFIPHTGGGNQCGSMAILS